MKYDKNLANLFLLNFNEAYRSAGLLQSSYARIASLMPLKGSRLSTLSEEEVDRLDAFRVRYSDLQDSLGNKIFRTLLLLEEESPGSNLDILNKMAKRRVIPSFEEWKTLRGIRNLFSHDYPETEDERAEVLNAAYSTTPKLLAVLNNVIHYTNTTPQLAMDHFPVLQIKGGEI